MKLSKKYENQLDILNTANLNHSFIFNNSICSLTLEQNDFFKKIANTLKLQNNCIQVPLIEKSKLVGFIEVEFNSLDSQISIYNFF